MKAKREKRVIVARTRRKIASFIDRPQPTMMPVEKHVPGQTFSAHGEDVLSISYLLAQGLKYEEITYLDVGAAEPSRLCNTYLLYLRGAKSVLVEPDPKSSKILRKERPRDTVVEAGVAFGKQRTATYHRFNKSVFNTFSAKQAKTVQK